MKINYLSLTIKLILILSIVTSINSHLWHIASTNLFLLILTFTPQIVKSSTKIIFPTQFEFLMLIFVLITLFLGKVGGIIAPIMFGVGTGLIALLILFILYSSNQIKRNPFLITIFSFSFAVSFGLALEMLKFYIKKIANHPIPTEAYTYTMMNLTYVVIGAIIASAIGLIYLKTRFSAIRKILKKIKILNPEIFKKSNSLVEIIEEIKKGESEDQEFKSTLRTNLHTNEPDKKIEHATLKTITAFMNSKKGVLYLGVTDDGKILGIKKDNFPSPDKFQLHLTNLIKQNIGKKYSRLISQDLIKIKDRHILRLDIKPSKSPVFLKNNKDEEFFIRIGPSTSRITGSELIEYVDKRFGKK